MRCFSFSEASGHIDNEDAFAVAQHPADPLCWLCVLADGMGGQSGGLEAAQIACRTALARAQALSVALLGNPDTWVSLLRGADEAVGDDPRAGFTTLLGFTVTGGTAPGLSCSIPIKQPRTER